MKPINQQGYILTECLIGLIILTTIGITLVKTLPTLLQIQQQLEIEYWQGRMWHRLAMEYPILSLSELYTG